LRRIKGMKKLMMILAMCIAFSVPVWAGEDYHDGNTQQTHVWIQEGDARFCYWNTGGWSEEDMLVGFHTIGDYVYYFSEQETNEWRYGQMVTGTIRVCGGVYTFDSAGHMTSIYGGLE
jgi:hypothetical protein